MTKELVEGTTVVVAWWGAITATLVLIWDIVKWIKSGPWLRVSVRPNTIYHDSARKLVKDDGHGNREEQVSPSIHIEIINLGLQPTTILGISAERHLSIGGSAGYDGSRFQAHYDKQLPYLLGSGEVWSCRVDQDIMSRLPGEGPVRAYITVSHAKKPMIVDLLAEKNFLGVLAKRFSLRP